MLPSRNGIGEYADLDIVGKGELLYAGVDGGTGGDDIVEDEEVLVSDDVPVDKREGIGDVVATLLL